MRVALGLILLSIAVASAIPDSSSSPLENGVYDYHRRSGIPQAQKVKQFEDGILRGERVAGGSTATTLGVPYQAGLIMTVLFLSSVCSGAIISNTAVLSAAHCINDGNLIASSVTVVVGSNFLFTGGTRFTEVNAKSHPEYNPRTATNDIVLLLVPQIQMSITVQQIELPLYTNELASNYAGSTGLASGFGVTSQGDSIGLLQTISSVNLQVISNEECESFYPGIIHNTHLCTSGAGGVGICGGDTGGPLVVSMSWNRRILVGISSFISVEGCDAGRPSGFTRVTSFIGWIFANL